MVRQCLSRVQAKGQRPYGKKLVRLYGIPYGKARGIPPWLDELLWDFGVLSADPRNRSLAAKASADVLLEAMAQVSHQGAQSP